MGSPYWMAPECLRGREYCEQVESETERQRDRELETETGTGTKRQRAGDRDREIERKNRRELTCQYFTVSLLLCRLMYSLMELY